MLPMYLRSENTLIRGGVENKLIFSRLLYLYHCGVDAAHVLEVGEHINKRRCRK
jgi:hypothetical protein